jgi:hypothetical protein
MDAEPADQGATRRLKSVETVPVDLISKPGNPIPVFEPTAILPWIDLT